MSLLRLGVLVSGRGSNLQAVIDNCTAGLVPAEVAVVISDKENAYALERAGNHGIPAVYINPGDFVSKEEYEAAVVRHLQENRVELVVLAGYMRIVGKVLLNSYSDKIMNIHPALLPSFPGTHGQKDAVDYGVRFSGCTVHFVDEGMDTGPIILQAVVPVMQEDTADTLAARILEQEHKLFSEAINLYAQGKLEIQGRRVMIKEVN